MQENTNLDNLQSSHLCKLLNYSGNHEIEKYVAFIMDTEYSKVDYHTQISCGDALYTIRSSLFFSEYIKMLNALDYSLLYQSDIHGARHIERVAIHTFLICLLEEIPHDWLKICIAAAEYHDIGRFDDTENPFHGLYGANKLQKCSIPLNCFTETEQEMIRFLVAGHSVDDMRAEEFFRHLFRISENEKNNVLKMLAILKDADALDRFRLTLHSLDPRFLRNKSAKRLIRFALDLYLLSEYETIDV